MRFERACGTLLHLTSLPEPHGSGDFGDSAYRFVDWLRAAGQSVWQILPLVGIGRGNSPYMSPSAFAGNPLLIDLNELRQLGWLQADELEPGKPFPSRQIDFENVIAFRMEKLALAAQRFGEQASAEQRQEMQTFCEQQAEWLDDYALFMAIAEQYPGLDWCDWDAELAAREPAALAHASDRLGERIQFWKFCQCCFFRQWHRLRDYANERGIEIMGDTPIFVAYHSAEVWSHRQLFELGDDGRMDVVAGVPPDYFSETGQLWGNPLYRWDAHRQQGYRWWTERIRHSFDLYDRLRIDHFLGFVNYWEIPADSSSAINGQWKPGPGDELFNAVGAELGRLPIIAEDLGIVTNAVLALRQQFEFPGMAVLQFAWGSGDDNTHLPHRHETNSVVYTGTHDNDTTLGWWSRLGEYEKDFFRGYLNSDGSQPHWDLIHCALASPADTAIVPLQDYLGLDSSHRMNTPGIAHGNWEWRFCWSDVPDGLADDLAQLSHHYDRAPAPG